MPLEIVDCTQGSPEWFEARMGIPTASEFATVLAKGKDGGDSKTRKTYMLKLAGEILTGDPMDSYTNGHMERGKEMEDEARALYSFAYGAEPQRVGFIRNGRFGCSPDSLIGGDGGLEIKTALAHIQIERLERGTLPPEHRAQVQGCLWLAEREWWDFCSYWPKLPLFKVRVHREEEYIKTLGEAVHQFDCELQELVERIRRYGQPEEQAA